MTNSSLFSLSLCFLVLFHACVAQTDQETRHQNQRDRLQPNECQLNRINLAEPVLRFQSEGGVSELWDKNDTQFQCSGVQVLRHIIEERGLWLPQYSNGPRLIYVVQGSGVQGSVFPGCPETYQSSSESQVRGQSQRDQHQKVQEIQEGDVFAVPAGVTQWVYNNGRSRLVLVQVVDARNQANQLDPSHRAFFVAGNPYSVAGVKGLSNVFSGLDEELLAEAFNVNTEVARSLKGENDRRGPLVSVSPDLEIPSPRTNQEEERREREEEREREFRRPYNDVDETICRGRLKQNINHPSQPDVYNPHGGRVTSVNSFNLPILTYLQLSAEKVVLYRNAMLAPHWNINAHAVNYFTRGSGQVQIVDNNGKTVFDGQVREGQVLTVPQNFVVLKKASREGLQWVSFKTNDKAKISQLAGRVSVVRGLPEEVVASSYQVSREDARRIKENRPEVTVFSPGYRAQY